MNADLLLKNPEVALILCLFGLGIMGVCGAALLQRAFAILRHPDTWQSAANRAEAVLSMIAGVVLLSYVIVIVIYVISKCVINLV